MERFSASNAAKHMACHASANLEVAIYGFEHPVRDENMGAKSTGSQIHTLVEQLFGMQYVTPSKTTNFSAKDFRYVAQLLDHIADVWSRRRFNKLIEHTVEALWLTNPTKTTADLVLFVQDEIHILDYKWGLIPVEAEENEQLMFYAASYGHLAPKAKGVHVHILQPRADNFDSWFISTERLGQFMADARAAQDAILAGSTTFGPSDHCTFCAANPHSRGDKGNVMCPAMMKLLYPSTVDEEEILNL